MPADPRLLPGVIADVRSVVPDVGRERLAAKLRDHFDAAAVELELDRIYGPPPGLAG